MALDIWLPGEEGPDGLIARLKVLEPALPVVAMSANDERDFAAAVGAYAFLAKPFAIDEMLHLGLSSIRWRTHQRPPYRQAEGGRARGQWRHLSNSLLIAPAQLDTSDA